jgi:hypothetical protein
MSIDSVQFTPEEIAALRQTPEPLDESEAFEAYEHASHLIAEIKRSGTVGRLEAVSASQKLGWLREEIDAADNELKS